MGIRQLNVAACHAQTLKRIGFSSLRAECVFELELLVFRVPIVQYLGKSVGESG